MTAAIITIGDEILIGQIIDTNKAFIASNLSLLGIEVREMRSVSDKHDDILRCIGDMEGRVDLAVFTGGLGPTRDDITKKAFNEYFGGRMEERQEVLDHIKRLFRSRGFHLSETNRLQAFVPHNCRILTNREGTAPGMIFERGGTLFISLPGVPYEVKTMVEEELIPLLNSRMNGKIMVYRTIMTQGVPESYLAESLSEWEDNLPPEIKLAYLPSPGLVKLRLSAAGNKREDLEILLDQQLEKLRQKNDKHIFAYEEISLEALAGDLLRKSNATLATAESCTGGRIASLITSVPGSSEYFKASIVAYSNEVKIKELSVDPAILERDGAVSEKVVEMMAVNARKKFNTDFAIAVSGIAGPGGGSAEKPVGTTWIGLASAEKCICRKFLFGDHRGRNIEKAAQTALNMLRELILNKE